MLLLSGDHIYRMNYQELIDFHIARGADATVATIDVPDEDKSRFGVCQTDTDGRITHFVEKPKTPVPGLGSMGIYVFDYRVLDRVLLEDHAMASSNHDFGKDILPRMIGRGERVFSWHYRGYWRDVGTLESYWEAHMDLLGSSPKYDLNDLGWLIHTRSENRPPARVGNGATLSDCLIAHGCEIMAGATVERSILSPGVRVEPGAVIRDSVVLFDTVVERDAVVEHAILDSRCRIGRGARIGKQGSDALAVVGKSARVPGGITVAPGAEVGADVIASDFEGSTEVPAGIQLFTKRKPHEL